MITAADLVDRDPETFLFGVRQGRGVLLVGMFEGLDLDEPVASLDLTSPDHGAGALLVHCWHELTDAEGALSCAADMHREEASRWA